MLKTSLIISLAITILITTVLFAIPVETREGYSIKDTRLWGKIRIDLIEPTSMPVVKPIPTTIPTSIPISQPTKETIIAEPKK